MAFRKELLADSTRAIEALAGEKLPEDFKLKVIENDPAYTATWFCLRLIRIFFGFHKRHVQS